MASTGPIGVHLEVDKIMNAIPELVERKGVTADPFALAIMTTDLVPKSVSTEVHLQGGVVRITGIAKGSGMIHPNMATMLGYFLTDAALTQELSYSLLQSATEHSFNRISVDGETSTNDCVFFLANGATGVSVKSDHDQALFQKALTEISIFLAKAIARDGEGATKLIEVNLKGSPSEELAKRWSRSLVTSPLVKTAIHGGDPNWGRILARLGAEAVSWEILCRMSLRLQGILIFQKGAPLEVDLEMIRKELKADTVVIDVDFESGNSFSTAWGCDLSKKYVEINSEYLT
jgi:glutamate N-acetyltransferase/amino-acid N-acetyltransferase